MHTLPSNQSIQTDPVVTELTRELRSIKRWRIFSKVISTAFVVSLSAVLLAGLFVPDERSLAKQSEHLAVVRLEGVIASGGDASASRINKALRDAFENANSRAVVILANSPGGSPVQAGMIADEIKHLRETYPNKPIVTLTEEVCASGCYYVAAATQNIYANKASVVGSIGVIMEGFGFNELMQAVGVERRLITAGENKAILDPFSPEKEQDRAYFQALVDEVHQQFIDVVVAGRGERIDASNQVLFSGLVWTGARAKTLGLVDDLYSMSQLSRQQYDNLEFVDYSIQESLEERLAQRLGASVSDAAIKALRAQPQADYHLR